MDTGLLSQIFFTVFGGLFGSYLTKYINRNREKVVLAFDMHKELNNVDMSKHRRLAALLIEKYPNASFADLNSLDEEKAVSVFMLMRFYQRLWLSIKHNQIKKNLVPELFAEIFYYWYYLSYRHNLINLNWNASYQMKELAYWFEKNDKSKKYLADRDWADTELSKRLQVKQGQHSA